MSRCLELARELATPRKPRVSDDLVELDFGAWEGTPWEAVPRDELNAWAADVWGYRPGGGESAAMAAGRWRGLVESASILRRGCRARSDARGDHPRGAGVYRRVEQRDASQAFPFRSAPCTGFSSMRLRIRPPA